ncbi:hypothetical protein PWT90_10552 [Aphanocladium album]|nr:hypothetical protein PWT90_10552 [Aphanocladium album]
MNSLTRRPIRPFSIPGRVQPSRGISEENAGQYCAGGCHAQTWNGAYSTVWLAFDLHSAQHVAIKVLTTDSYGQENDVFEIDILKHLRGLAAAEPGSNHILQPLDNFQQDGPNGTHACLVFAAMGLDI